MQPQYDKSYTISEYVNTVTSTIKIVQSCNTRFPLSYNEVLEKDKTKHTHKRYHLDLLQVKCSF